MHARKLKPPDTQGLLRKDISASSVLIELKVFLLREKWRRTPIFGGGFPLGSAYIILAS